METNIPVIVVTIMIKQYNNSDIKKTVYMVTILEIC